MKMVVFRAYRNRQGRCGRILRYAESRKYDGLNVKGQKTAEESLKSETKHGRVSGQKTEKEEKKMARYLASIEVGNTQVFHEEGDNLKSLLFELGKRAVDYVFDASEMSKEVAMYSIYDFEKRDNVYFSVLHNVKGAIEEVAERTTRK